MNQRAYFRKIRMPPALDNMTPEESAKKHLRTSEISNLSGTAFGWGSFPEKSNLIYGPIIGGEGQIRYHLKFAMRDGELFWQCVQDESVIQSLFILSLQSDTVLYFFHFACIISRY